MSTDSKRVALDVIDWMWGTVKGSFNDKIDISQIVVDAVIGMIPLVGDVTAARDLIAISLGLSGDPKKREDKMQWVLLVIDWLAKDLQTGWKDLEGVGYPSINVAGGAHTEKLAEHERQVKRPKAGGSN